MINLIQKKNYVTAQYWTGPPNPGTTLELFPIVALRYFDAQWEAYRNDHSRFHEDRKPEFRNLDQFKETFQKKIDSLRDPETVSLVGTYVPPLSLTTLG